MNKNLTGIIRACYKNKKKVMKTKLMVIRYLFLERGRERRKYIWMTCSIRLTIRYNLNNNIFSFSVIVSNIFIYLFIYQVYFAHFFQHSIHVAAN